MLHVRSLAARFAPCCCINISISRVFCMLPGLIRFPCLDDLRGYCDVVSHHPLIGVLDGKYLVVGVSYAGITPAQGGSRPSAAYCDEVIVNRKQE